MWSHINPKQCSSESQPQLLHGETHLPFSDACKNPQIYTYTVIFHFQSPPGSRHLCAGCYRLKKKKALGGRENPWPQVEANLLDGATGPSPWQKTFLPRLLPASEGGHRRAGRCREREGACGWRGARVPAVPSHGKTPRHPTRGGRCSGTRQSRHSLGLEPSPADPRAGRDGVASPGRFPTTKFSRGEGCALAWGQRSTRWACEGAPSTYCQGINLSEVIYVMKAGSLLKEQL